MRPTDSQLQTVVLQQLKLQPCLAEVSLGVSVDDGVVTLHGTVDTHHQRQAAQEAAHATVGVLDVANDLRVGRSTRGGRNDTEIAQAVRIALQACDGLPSQRLRSTVTHGWVLLEGDLDSDAERDAAIEAARSTVCVVGVNDAIHVRGNASEERGSGLETNSTPQRTAMA